MDAVGLVPGPNEKGQNWIKNFLNQIQKEEDLKELGTIECGSERAIQEGELSVTHQLCMSHTFFRMSSFLFSFVSSFITSWKHLH